MTKIEWTGRTWNPMRGCRPVSPGCAECYAKKQARRFSGPGKAYEGLTKLTARGVMWTGRSLYVPDRVMDPLRWRKPSMVFVDSMSDLFYEGFEDHLIDEVWAVMLICAHHEVPRGHIFQVLTKRVQRMREYLTAPGLRERLARAAGGLMEQGDRWFDTIMDQHRSLTPPSIWIGASVEDQTRADQRIPELINTPAETRFLSCEPLLGPLDFTPPEFRGTNVNRNDWLEGIDWVIVGGESGSGARPVHPDWVRSIRDACVDRTDMGRPWPLAFFFKQWGDWMPVSVYAGPQSRLHTWSTPSHQMMERVGKKAAGRKLDGQIWGQFPSWGRHLRPEAA